jgi:hypothetical protein
MERKYIYVIATIDDLYFYIGVTKNVKKRLQQHNDGEGAAWTKHILTLRPSGFKLVENRKLGDPLEEDFVTKQYMVRYDIHRVRGGAYSQVVLQDWQYRALATEIAHAKNECFKCGGTHYVATCVPCVRCGIGGHDQDMCSAEYDEIWGWIWFDTRGRVWNKNGEHYDTGLY